MHPSAQISVRSLKVAGSARISGARYPAVPLPSSVDAAFLNNASVERPKSAIFQQSIFEEYRTSKSVTAGKRRKRTVAGLQVSVDFIVTMNEYHPIADIFHDAPNTIDF